MKYNYFEPEIQWQPSQKYSIFIWLGFENLTTYDNPLGTAIVIATDVEQARWFLRQSEAVSYKSDVYEYEPTLKIKLASQQKHIRPCVIVCPSTSELKRYVNKKGDVVLDRFKG